MEDGDSDTDKYPHRTGNNAGHDFVHGTWTVQFLRKPLPPTPPLKGRGFLLGKHSLLRMPASLSAQRNRPFCVIGSLDTILCYHLVT